MYQRSTFSYLKLIVKLLKNRLPSYLNALQHSEFKREIYETLLLGYNNRGNTSYQDMVNYHSVYTLALAVIWNALPVPLITNVHYSLFKSNVFFIYSLLIRKH